MDHTLDVHKFRLNSIFRICAKKSSTTTRQTKECEQYLKAIRIHYKIDLETDSEL